MKAAVVSISRYGPPDVIQIQDLEKPVPKDNEVLINVCAAAVNPLDRTWMRGTPYLVRMMGGLRELIEAGKITPVIDRCYRLSEVPEAIRYWEEGHARGKVIITLE